MKGWIAVNCVAATLAAAPIALAYRTGHDLPDFADTPVVRWTDPRVEFVMQPAPQSGVGGDDELSSAVRRSVETWGAPQCSLVLPVFSGLTGAAPASADGVNSIGWVGTNWADLGVPNDAAATTDIQYQQVGGSWRIVEADIYLNAENFNWSLDPTDVESRYLPAVLVHELGHALGLLHPCELDYAAVAQCTSEYDGRAMHPVYSATHVTLATDDEAGICFLYPGTACDETECPSGTVCTEFGCLAVCGGEVCGSGQSCIAGACHDSDAPCSDASCLDVCDTEVPCEAGSVCEKGRCHRLLAPLGDPCGTSADCESGSCSPAGYCVAYCGTEGECGFGRCVAETHSCDGDTRQPQGASCDSADDCFGGYCIADRTPEPVCSRACGPVALDCPFDWNCESVEGEDVCVEPSPPDIPEGCGCRLASAPEASSSDTSFAAILAAMTTLQIRRRRKASQARYPQSIQ